MPVLVDSNVILDLVNRDEVWFEWSFRQISEQGNRDILVINQMIAAEVSVSYESMEAMHSAFEEAQLAQQSIPWEAAFLAGRCFLDYRRRGGTRRSPLPDFYIGAHAAVAGMPLRTRDARRYRTYFPKLRLIAPD